jgi:hypothetical protein
MNLESSATTTLEPPPAAVRDHTHILRWRASNAAAIITALVMLGTTTTMFLPWSRGDGLGTFTFEHIQLLGMVDTGPQRLTHRVGLILLAVLCVLGAAAITRPAAHTHMVTQSLRMTGPFLRKWSGLFLAVAATLVLVFDLNGTVFPGPEGRKLLLEFWLLSAFLITL